MSFVYQISPATHWPLFETKGSSWVMCANVAAAVAAAAAAIAVPSLFS